MRFFTPRASGVAAVGVSLALSAALVGLGLSHHLPGSGRHLAPPPTTTTLAPRAATPGAQAHLIPPVVLVAPTSQPTSHPAPSTTTTTGRPAPAPSPQPKPPPCVTVPIVGGGICPPLLP